MHFRSPSPYSIGSNRGKSMRMGKAEKMAEYLICDLFVEIWMRASS